MRVLVIGATGGTGREIVRQALAGGHEVTALVRDPEAAARALPGARTVRGDVRDPDAVAQAVDGQEAVASALGSGVTFRRQTQLSDGTKALVAAMTARGVRRLVCITGIGAGDSRGHGGAFYDWFLRPVVLRQVYADKDRQEAVVRSSGLDWVIVRPALLTDGPAAGRYRVLTDLDSVRGGSVSRADVADFVVKQLTDRQYLGRTPFLVT